MSCNRCALRRFDGHGTPYKPTNTVAAKEVANSLSRMMAERELQDAGIFIRHSAPIVKEEPIYNLQKQQIQQKQKQEQQSNTFYSLSDSC
jgi:hypothetical protein